MSATIKDVADYAQVAVSTVSRVINNKDRVSPETRKKVFEANVRSGPGTDYGVIRTLAGGNEVDVLEKYSNGWVKINIVGRTGYVNVSYLNMKEEQETKRMATVIGCTALNVRSTPNGTVVGTVKCGTVLEVTGTEKDSDGDIWYQISAGHLAGFVWPKYVK